jgi:hypothetical protein
MLHQYLILPLYTFHLHFTSILRLFQLRLHGYLNILSYMYIVLILITSPIKILLCISTIDIRFRPTQISITCLSRTWHWQRIGCKVLTFIRTASSVSKSVYLSSKISIFWRYFILWLIVWDNWFASHAVSESWFNLFG